ncbi:porin family protein [Sphingomonas sediminicola]|uniref:surface lipoprotein assembly modifier n=1 Tax=Sphingomonas sediminicola TaxID=386874 RepID=UPI003CF44043
MARVTYTGLLFGLTLGCGTLPTPSRAEASAPTMSANDPSGPALAQAARLLAAGQLAAARAVVDGLAGAGHGGLERDFLDGMISYSGKDYRRAEAMFRRILDRDPKLLRVRLELARTLYMEKKDEQADYQFSLAAAEQTSSQVRRNIANFRQAIRARRSWRLNVDFGFAPDSNINSATEKESVNIYGLPFRLDPDARARSGTGRFVGGDASIRLSRFGQVPIYIGAYGRWIRYKDHRFDDAYAGLEAGPEFAVAGGRLRTTATVLKRWYGGHSLVSSLGARADYEKIVGGGWNIGGTLIVRHNDYAQRGDVDGWSLEARASASRPLGLTTLGFADATIERGTAADRGQAYWRGRIGFGAIKEIGWGLRPQIRIDLARQINDGPLAPFAKRRQDLLLEGSLSIYKRDWNVEGFAPSVSVTATRNSSALPLYDERRLRGEVRLMKAF